MFMRSSLLTISSSVLRFTTSFDSSASSSRYAPNVESSSSFVVVTPSMNPSDTSDSSQSGLTQNERFTGVIASVEIVESEGMS